MTTSLLEHAEYAPLFHSCEVIRGQDNALMQRGFLPVANYLDRCEIDEYDASSAHFCAFNLRHELVGYVRLVPPDLTQSFPFQSHCSALLEGAALAPPAQAAEISRLMVRHDYRRRRGSRPAGVTAGQAFAVSPGVRRDDASQVLLTLYRQMYAYSRANDISHWYAAMERSLMRMNIAFRAIGPQTDYYGPVAPYLASLQEVEAQVKARDPGLFAWLQKAERRSVKPAFVN
jgi:N-acyl amino acid synthase of PEP-CTERM/exosortase system